MPIPKPKPSEKEDDYIGRCMSAIGGEYDDRNQALAVCYSKYKEARKSMTVHDDLLNEIKSRESVTEFNYGILTADRYVKSMQQMCGDEVCYRYVSAKNRGVSLDDAIKTAAKKLTYSNVDMVVEDVYSDFKSKLSELSLGDDFELPKNTLMVFRHILTTPRKDRDGDIMRTQGAKPDPKMVMLWNHVHTLPIGKMLAVVNHNSKVLEVVSAIVDMNDLSHDAAVMVENKMGRFSHGFKATEFTKIKSVRQMDDLTELLGVEFDEAERAKAKDGKATGFDVSGFEVMEESMVTVPSNVDAEVTDVYLSLLDGKQLRSRMMKSYGETLRSGLAKKFPVAIDLKLTVNGKSVEEQNDEDKPGEEKGDSGGCSCGGAGTPKQEGKPKTAKEEQADTDGKEMMCPECGGKIVDGVCKKCGYKMDSKDDDDEKDAGQISEKMYYHGMLVGSWEYIESKLREKAKKYLIASDIGLSDNEWATVIATYSDYAIISCERMGGQRLYRVRWKNADDPEFYGEPKEVEIEISTKLIEKMCEVGRKRFESNGEKSGRVLSKSNYDKLVSVRDDMGEMHESQYITTRSGMALCKSCMTKLTEVIDSAKMDTYGEVDKQTEFTVKSAMTFFLHESTEDEQDRMIDALKAFRVLRDRKSKEKTLRDFLGV